MNISRESDWAHMGWPFGSTIQSGSLAVLPGVEGEVLGVRGANSWGLGEWGVESWGLGVCHLGRSFCMA